ncbi:MAG: translocation/assembly module TamB, partial [Muribaculaceae bacterium]|nr:translocation/assembly module TamB [Muribaculaceae bacterium]
LRNAQLRYDVLSMPQRSGLDPNHISLRQLHLTAYLPRLSNEQYSVEIDRLSFREAGGFVLSDFTTRADVRTNGIDLWDLRLSLPESEIIIAPVHLDFERFEQIPLVLANSATRIELVEGSNIWLPDLAAICRPLERLPLHLDLDMLAEASLSDVKLQRLNISDRHGATAISLHGSASHPADSVPLQFNLESLEIHGRGSEICEIISALTSRRPKALDILCKTGDFTIGARAEGSLRQASAEVSVNIGREIVHARGLYSADADFRNIAFKADVNADNINLARFANDKRLGLLNASVSANGRLSGRRFSGQADVQCKRIGFNGYDYSDITASADISPRTVTLSLNSADPNACLSLDGECDYSAHDKRLSASLGIDSLNLNALGLIAGYDGHRLTGHMDLLAEGSGPDDLTGSMQIDGLSFSGLEKSAGLRHAAIELDRKGDYAELSITSDIINGQAAGQIAFSTIATQMSDMVSDVFPALARHKDCGETPNRFSYDFTISDTNELTDFFRIPVRLIYPVELNGTVNSDSRYADLTVDAPYLQQGNKIIENTALVARIDGAGAQSMVYGTTKMPTKKGPLGLVFTLDGCNNRIDSHFDWMIERRIPINGKIDFSTLLSRDDESNALAVDVDFNRSDITFGNDIWEISPSHLKYDAGAIHIDGFGLHTPRQSIAIDGVAGKEFSDSLTVRLDNVELIEIFETLEIDKALIGGRASGTVSGNALLSKTPVIQSDSLFVENISYNRCTLGNADVKARFDNEKQAFGLDADITEPGGRHSHIYGDIYPATESLDISFDADRVRVGFMQPFMSAFASSIDGYASGHARLFGTFKYIDMEGDIFADSLQVKIDFTNTCYSATDSIHLRPGLIDIRNVTVRDPEGHTAVLNGKVEHTFFKEPVFDFSVTGARDFLCYDTDSRISPDWYGRVYGNGSAFISGWPGVVNINVNMTTAPRSRFTFVLSDQLIADEYSFITFRRKPGTEVETADSDDTPPEVRLAREQAAQQSEDIPSAYNMDIQVDITPDAAMTIVMDPVGGDEIKATGAGNLRLTYGSLNNDLRMYGVYTLESGSYNFTLQDIIIKDFTIDQGSSIAFHGDPYNAQLDLKAVYTVNANLSDLDESFLQDKDLNRTNVPVQALLMVKGDMRQPDISFDLLFPTLNEDIYRKVHSIVSTEDMMNRQIIYLLALNRFYTPDYMASTTKGNEVFAVASSTISSQLSSILGKLSDHWS